MDIKNIVKFVLKKKVYVILITIIFALTGFGYAFSNVKYVSSKKFLIENADNKIDTYIEIMGGSTVLDKVAENLGDDITASSLRKVINVSKIDNTNMIELQVVEEDPTNIKKYSDEIEKVFVSTVNEICSNTQVYNVDNSNTYLKNDNIWVATLVSGLLGGLFSSVFFAVCFCLNNKVKSSKDIENIANLKTLICIPHIKVIAKKKLNIKNMRAHKSEVFKTLMTNIQFVNVNKLKSQAILITSAKPLEGKTYVANNLAMEFAKAGKKVIIIDADMRRGRLAKIFNLPNDLGFSNYLSSLDSNGNSINERITRFIKDTEIKNLNVITAGNVPPNPANLLETAKLEELIKDLKVFYDVIIFDTVPVLETKEATILAKVSDLTLILSAYGNTKKEDLKIAYERINNIEGTCIGMGLNKIPDTKFKKKMAVLKNNFKQFLRRVQKNTLKKLNVVSKVKPKIVSVFRRLFAKIKDFKVKITAKTQNVKKYIEEHKSKKEKIKLIEAGGGEPLENNVVKQVFESEIAKIENNIEKVKKENVVVSKPKKVDTDILKEKEKIEIEKKEKEKRLRQEKITNHKEVDFSIKENLTEEMIRRQVEIDDLVRLSEKEAEEEVLKLQQKKYKQKVLKKQERKQKIDDFMAKVKARKQELETLKKKRKASELEERVKRIAEQAEKKAQKEAEKRENQARLEKVKEEKKAYKEQERQKYLTELKIKEELQEDNLYPKPRM